jgi:hypothetical protein
MGGSEQREKRTENVGECERGALDVLFCCVGWLEVGRRKVGMGLSLLRVRDVHIQDILAGRRV